MDEKELNEILRKTESELTGDPEHDGDLLYELGERYRGKPGSEPLLNEIGHRLFALMIEEEGDMPQRVYESMVETADDDYEEALSLIDQGRYEEALSKLFVLKEVIRIYPLSDDTDWKDFSSYLDAMIYQDLYSDEAGDREIGRHPMHPGNILFTCGSLLIEMDRAEEAIEPLEMLFDLDPVCPKYLFELGEAYKRTGQIEEAYAVAFQALSCASEPESLARAYRDMAFCMTEDGAYEDAVMLYKLSIRFQASRRADMELILIQRNTGLSPNDFSDEAIIRRCAELNIPVGISETVRMNMELLHHLMDGSDEEDNE